MSQITLSLPYGNTLTLEDNGPNGRANDRFDASTDRVLINGGVFYQPGQRVRRQDSSFTYFLHVLNIDSLSQITSLQRAAQIFRIREEARQEAVAGHCDRSDELVRSANSVALGDLGDEDDDMPTISYRDLYSLNIFLPDQRPDGSLTPILNSAEAYLCAEQPRGGVFIREYHQVTPSPEIRRRLEEILRRPPRRHR